MGARARYGVTLAWPATDTHFPWAIFTIDTSGAFLLGLILTVLLEHPGRWPWARPPLCVRFLGAWTTTSTLALNADPLAKDGRAGTAVAYVLATLVAGPPVVWAGIGSGRRLSIGRVQWPSR